MGSLFRIQVTIFLFLICCASANAQKLVKTEVLVIGGGTGGTAAGIQSARAGVPTIIIEPSPWLGGMISAAGVSAVDGNHQLPSGLWAEFRNHLYQVYGGPKEVETGWVSNTLFEPHVADSIFKKMAGAEKNLTVLFNFSFRSVNRKGNRITSATFYNKQTKQSVTIQANVFIDATELGDVMAAAKEPYDLGMEAGGITGENVGVTQSNRIVQDLTYVAILKDYGVGTDVTISRPRNYDPSEFDGSSTDYYKDKKRKAPTVDGKTMLEYGKLPRNKYMINWPIFGNDTYLNIVEMNEAQREKELVKAKETTYRFVYFIQHQLGFKNLGLADDEFPTKDRLALMPYHREGRRVKGLVRFTIRHIAEPFTYGDPLYRTGIAVGDYPIDHHHKKNLKAPQHLDFYSVPSFTIPLGSLIPKQTSNLIIAEKGISVSNVANGTTRLQPCVLLTGQAAGMLAALSAMQKKTPANIDIRTVQEELLKAKTYIMPYIDVQPTHPQFEAIQKIGATGILKGKGIPFKWANQTWFYPDSLVKASVFISDYSQFSRTEYKPSGEWLTIKDALNIIVSGNQKQLTANPIKTTPSDYTTLLQQISGQWKNWGLKDFDETRKITRAELALMIQKVKDPFSRKVDHKGRFR
jgi:hypothetical protein